MLQLVVAAVLAITAKIEEAKPKLPKHLKATGKVVAVATFEDKNGSHTTYVEQGRTKKGDLELHAYDYAGTTRLWQANDFVRDCELDQVLAYRPKSLGVTDLDDDGEAEISFAYELTCAGDVGPRTLKLLMYEGSTKYALRGETRVDVGGGEKAGGTYELDPALARGPRVFIDHLEGRWRTLVGD